MSSNKISLQEALLVYPKKVEAYLFDVMLKVLLSLGEDIKLIPWSNNVVSAKMREQGLYSGKDKYSDEEEL